MRRQRTRLRGVLSPLDFGPDIPTRVLDFDLSGEEQQHVSRFFALDSTMNEKKTTEKKGDKEKGGQDAKDENGRERRH